MWTGSAWPRQWSCCSRWTPRPTSSTWHSQCPWTVERWPTPWPDLSSCIDPNWIPAQTMVCPQTTTWWSRARRMHRRRSGTPSTGNAICCPVQRRSWARPLETLYSCPILSCWSWSVWMDPGRHRPVVRWYASHCPSGRSPWSAPPANKKCR